MWIRLEGVEEIYFSRPSSIRACASQTYESLSFAEVDQWRTCQGCAHNPLRQPQAVATPAPATLEN